jgi:hypothetical protein
MAVKAAESYLLNLAFGDGDSSISWELSSQVGYMIIFGL